MENETKSSETFTVKARAKSFGYAFKGIGYLVKSQHNVWIHLSVTALVIAAAVLLKADLTGWALLVFAIGIVLVAEMFNTAIEIFVNFVSPGYNEKAGKIKDLAAAGVLMSALTAAIIGLIVFVPLIIGQFK
ncbi:MAG: diacylglycerol kinase family protein [Bacteroidetes bacterium]|nr:diacylglycerol kinase family protein [Bacteroidota bacterium]